MGTIGAEQQPAGKALLEVMFCITACRLSRLDKLRLNVLQSE
jgi:hypothetical protein